jgi:hypothetical protein
MSDVDETRAMIRQLSAFHIKRISDRLVGTRAELAEAEKAGQTWLAETWRARIAAGESLLATFHQHRDAAS